ncbi:DHHA1 domain-containing protein, partial [Kozakia baliensis]
EAPDRLAALIEERRTLERQVSELQRRIATGEGSAATENVNGVTLAARDLGEVAPKELKGMAEAIAKQVGSGVVALVSSAEGKGSVVIAVTPDLSDRFNAVDLVRAASAAMGGKGGGGRPDMAQAGGPNPNAKVVFDMLRERLST